MKRLIIAPHVDDDVLGCGGILDETCVVFYCGVDDHHRVSAAERFKEARAVAAATGHMFWWPQVAATTEGPGMHMIKDAFVDRGGVAYAEYGTPRRVNYYALPSLIRDLEHVLRTEEPDEVYIPESNSYNQDHQTVHTAAMIALRPHDEIPFVPRVLAYEQPHVLLWPVGQQPQVNYFREIDIEEKIARYELMPSQVRDFRSQDAIAALAKLRGEAARVPFAEAFRIVRWVE